MSVFQRAIDLNNKGIRSLVEGNKESAIQAMSISIKLMKASLPESTSFGDAAEFSKCSVPQQTPPTIVIPGLESSETIVCNRAVYIPTTSLTTDKLHMNTYIGAVIYNLALAHQSLGIQACINKAEKLYSLALQLLEDDLTLRCMQMALIVKLGCINNLSQIRYSKCDYENAREGLQHVSHFMNSNQEMFQDQPEIMGLLMNVLLLRPPTVASAA